MTPVDQLKKTSLDRELAEFEEQEARSLGLNGEKPIWTEQVHDSFTADQKDHTTILISGLTLAHDTLVGGALRGLKYHVRVLDCPDHEALQFGKEFGNRGQCNPTWYTVGNLVKHLVHLRDVEGLSTKHIIEKHLFVTAGACGPCRFGTYVTEYRKALRDAGFDGFRVMLFQQQGGLKQATGPEVGLKIDTQFVLGIVRAMVAGDVLNLMGYRIRPYEKNPGDTDAAVSWCREALQLAFEKRRGIARTLRNCRKTLEQVSVDRSSPKPVVSIIGEFWAMTTEGDGSYGLQSFLESEGAEVDIQGVSNWLLFMIWENRFDTRRRIDLRKSDTSRKGLGGKRPTLKMLKLALAEKGLRILFSLYGRAIGLHRYKLPDMDEIARLAKNHFDLEVRGGEGHMEVGKLVHFIEDEVNHMTVSIKPFGCMPSSGVSDGVQSAIMSRYPEAIFLPVETTGDGAVNVQSRIQMMLFKARQKARTEWQAALDQRGWTPEEFSRNLETHRLGRQPLARPKHRCAGTAANLILAVG